MGSAAWALATMRRFNAKLSAKGHVWFWPKIAAALTSKHHWLVIACDSCDSVVDLDLRVKPRDPDASIHVALRDVRCPRCNGHGPAHHCVGATPFDLVPCVYVLARASAFLHRTGAPSRRDIRGAVESRSSLRFVRSRFD